MPVKKVIWRWSKEVFFFIYVSYQTRGSTLYFLNVNKYWHDRKRWEKESNTVKGARFFFIVESITSLLTLIFWKHLLDFKVVKWKSCFILLRGILVLWYGSQINSPNYTKSKKNHWHGRKGWEKESNIVKGAR